MRRLGRGGDRKRGVNSEVSSVSVKDPSVCTSRYTHTHAHTHAA